MHGERVRLEREGEHIAVLVMVNDDAGCLDEASERELAAALDAIEADASVRAVVVTGTGEGVFVRHYDVRTLEARGRAMAARGLSFSTDRPVPESPYLRCLRRIGESPRPFVAAIDGIAMGGGFELALACDLRLAQAGDYPIGLPEVRIGLLPGAGGTQRLARLVGPGVAMRSLLLGRTWTPEQARSLGLVDECVDGPVRARAEDVTAPAIRAWLRANPAQAPEVMRTNPSVVFFRELPPAPPVAPGEPEAGPPGSLGVPLTALRSLAVDRSVVPLASLLWLDTTDPVDGRPLRRAMAAQDTGGALAESPEHVGALAESPEHVGADAAGDRADVFWGFGERAERAAGLMRERGRMWVLWPRGEVPPGR